jgi:putative DNA primase/helicase
MKPDPVKRELASEVAPSNVTGSATFAVQRIIAGKDSQAAFKAEFIQRCSLLTTEELWDVRLLLHRAYPKDGFGPRGEFSRRIKVAQIDLDPPERRAGWTAGLLLNDSGAAKPVLANAISALELAPEWQGVVGFDEFSQRLRILKAAPWERSDCDWQDRDDTELSNWLQHQGIMVSSALAHEAASSVGYEHSYHPVKAYLSSLEPSDEVLLNSWLSTFVGVDPGDEEQSRYVSAVGRKWMISAVARIFQPGCKADCCLLIEGKTGVGKSTTLQVLGQPWFMDSLLVLGNHDFYQTIQGKWIIEIADLAGYNKAEIEMVKSVFSSSCDTYRKSYGRNAEDHPRQCVFACTTEADNWSKEASARRFWPVAAGTVDMMGLKNAKHQLWAEAVRAYKAGENWYLDQPELVKASQSEQLDRWERHPWLKSIEEYVSQLAETCSEDILRSAVQKPLERQTRADQMAVGGCLRFLGWSKRKAWDGTVTGGRSVQKWYPPRSED